MSINGKEAHRNGNPEETVYEREVCTRHCTRHWLHSLSCSSVEFTCTTSHQRFVNSVTLQFFLPSSMYLSVKYSFLSLLMVICTTGVIYGQSGYHAGYGNGAGYGQMCYDGYTKDAVIGSVCMNKYDCSDRYGYADCEMSTMPIQGYQNMRGASMCYCRCGYKFDISTNSCVSRDWWYSSGVILAITITILVIVIVILAMTIPTCAGIFCMGKGQ